MKKTDIASLFRPLEGKPQFVGLGNNLSFLKNDSKPNGAVGIVAHLADPNTYQPSGKLLILQVRPKEAMILARAILEVAKARDWPEPTNEHVATRVLNGPTVH